MKSKNYEIVANELVNKLTTSISGSSEDFLFGKKPSETVMLGMVKAYDVDSKQIQREETKYEASPSVGLVIRVPKGQKAINLKLKGKLYYRTTPSFDDNYKFLFDKYSKKYNRHNFKKEDFVDFIKDPEQHPDNPILFDSLMYLYKSIDLSELIGFQLLNCDDLEHSLTIINKRVNDLIDNKAEELNNNHQSILCKKSDRQTIDFLDETLYNNLLNSTTIVYVKPKWEIELVGSINKCNEYNEITIHITNKTPSMRDSGTYETSIFDAGLCIFSENKFLDFEIEAIKKDFGYENTNKAVGLNCSINVLSPYMIETTNIPTFKQYRLVTNNEYERNTNFTSLIDDPINNLKQILIGLNRFYSKKREEFEKSKGTLNENAYEKYHNQIKDLANEVKRFEDGIFLIEHFSMIKQSFKLMNEVFRENGKNSKYTGWRMFQIVFIVSEIRDIVYSELKNDPTYKGIDNRNVDLIYFPTGGGKTETFFGCAIFTAFFDRLRGKNGGASVFIKYPLRLLTSQQLNRLLTITMNANFVKNYHRIGGDDFTVGFFTGSKNTENKISKDFIASHQDISQKDLDEETRQISVCPICKKEVHSKLDLTKNTITHICPEHGELPVYINDDYLYRNPPTFIVSTIDKTANIGTSVGYHSLLGGCTYKCEKHGNITSANNKCSIFGCNEKIVPFKIKDPAPTLFIQDELHLLSESLGTFDSHYEGFLQYYTENILEPEDRKPIKYIVATATISNYLEHCQNLYHRNCLKFPASVKGENLYSYIDTDQLSRIILGAALYGDSITRCIEKVVTIMRMLVLDDMNNLESALTKYKALGFDGDQDDLKSVLNNYLVSIIYNKSKNDGNNLKYTLENTGNNALLENGFDEFKFGEIMGDVDFKEISGILSEIINTPDKRECRNLIVATSSISHGVDADCFNQMFFFGIPNKTSEYIQAYSRVGRKFPGIVFDVIRLARDLDKSYLKNFSSFHEYKELLIDPVPINRWSKNAIYSTFPGILSGYIIQTITKSVSVFEAKRKIKENALTLQGLIDAMLKIYFVDIDPEGLEYKEIIESETEKAFFALQNCADSSRRISDVISDSNSKNKKMLTSLRITEDMLVVERKSK